jgi:hypothetical protein
MPPDTTDPLGELLDRAAAACRHRPTREWLQALRDGEAGNSADAGDQDGAPARDGPPPGA